MLKCIQVVEIYHPRVFILQLYVLPQRIPGSDGFASQFYKVFKLYLISTLANSKFPSFRNTSQLIFSGQQVFFFFFFGCVGSCLLHAGFLQLRRVGAVLHCGAQASHRGGFQARSTGSRHADFSSCSTWAQQLWHTGLVAPRPVGSSRTRDRTCVPCIGRQILNHCATREVPGQQVLIPAPDNDNMNKENYQHHL